mgnify:CR=1 FL=1
MSIINNNDQICLAYSGETYYDNCGGLLQETGEFLSRRKLILTDGQIDPFEADKELRDAAKGVPKIIYLEDCETTSISYPCNEPISTVDQGKFVEIVNTCTEPITVTGLNNSDPTRFTVFDLGYRGLETYHSGVCEELPFTVAPYTKKTIHSFFHPSRTEIEDGNAGSYENRTGDAWSAKISMYPGFPILGCEGMDPCDSFYTLSGELLCDHFDREPLKNLSNYQGVYGCTGNPMSTLRASDCLITSGVYTDSFNVGYDEYTAMQSLALSVEKEYSPYSNSNRADPPDDSMYMASALFKEASFASSSFQELLSKGFTTVQKTWRKSDGSMGVTVGDALEITGQYLNNYVTLNYEGELYTGMKVRVSVDESGPYVYDVGIFFNSEPANGNTFEPAIFMSEWGDFNKTKFCFARGDIELATEPYSPPSDIILWNNKKGAGSNVTQVTEEQIYRVGYLHGEK